MTERCKDDVSQSLRKCFEKEVNLKGKRGDKWEKREKRDMGEKS